MAITNSAKNVMPGMGSASVSYTLNDFAAASGAQTIICLLGVPVTTPPASGQAISQGSSPVKRGYVRVKTEAAVASFLVVALVGRIAPAGTGTQVVLYHGDVATALTGVTSAYVDQLYHFVSDLPLVEVDVMINAGAAVNISLEVVGGA